MTTSFNTSREALTAPIAAIPGPAADLSFPRVGTVRARVLAHFLDGRPLAHNEALRLRQTNRSGAELYAFKQRDLPSNSATFESSICIGSIAWTACISISEIEFVKAGILHHPHTCNTLTTNARRNLDENRTSTRRVFVEQASSIRPRSRLETRRQETRRQEKKHLLLTEKVLVFRLPAKRMRARIRRSSTCGTKSCLSFPRSCSGRMPSAPSCAPDGAGC